jgi:dinuclear metal center YbgI/SA1388 family protein
MFTVNDIEKALFEWAPASLAMKGDNNGLIAGDRRKPVTHALVSLDLSLRTIAEAVRTGADVIAAHHPVVWGDKLPFPTGDTDAGNILLTVCASGLAAISMHTNLDAAQGGINDVLAGLIGLENVTVFDEKDGIGRIGRLPRPMTAQDFAAQCKAALKTGVVRFADAGKPIQTAAICSGGGSFMLEDAIRAGCDAFLTGEAKHSTFITAQNQGVSLLECGHFATENVIVSHVAEYLRGKFPGLNVSVSNETAEPYQCL